VERNDPDLLLESLVVYLLMAEPGPRKQLLRGLALVFELTVPESTVLPPTDSDSPVNMGYHHHKRRYLREAQEHIEEDRIGHMC
tara:strand:- start:50 stop:301 length:252 start_codon:yes stop_codon:yes gene_type:complete